MYPNPTNSILNIINEQSQLHLTSVVINDLLGQTVYSKSFSNQIDISNLPNGVYFLTILDKSYKKSFKIIKE
jgi:hypothetical protein